MEDDYRNKRLKQYMNFIKEIAQTVHAYSEDMATLTKEFYPDNFDRTASIGVNISVLLGIIRGYSDYTMSHTAGTAVEDAMRIAFNNGMLDGEDILRAASNVYSNFLHVPGDTGLN